MKYDYTNTEIQELILARDILDLVLVHKDEPTSEITSDICFTLFRLIQDNNDKSAVDWHGLHSLLDKLYIHFKNNDEQGKSSTVERLQHISTGIQNEINNAASR